MVEGPGRARPGEAVPPARSRAAASERDLRDSAGRGRRGAAALAVGALAVFASISAGVAAALLRRSPTRKRNDPSFGHRLCAGSAPWRAASLEPDRPRSPPNTPSLFNQCFVTTSRVVLGKPPSCGVEFFFLPRGCNDSPSSSGPSPRRHCTFFPLPKLRHRCRSIVRSPLRLPQTSVRDGAGRGWRAGMETFWRAHKIRSKTAPTPFFLSVSDLLRRALPLLWPASCALGNTAPEEKPCPRETSRREKT